nr:MAG TPA: portal protein [Caudoviricetes sp.]
MLNGSIPVFAQFGTNIYASDVVQQAVNCIVLEMKKLNPQHIREIEHDITPVVSEVQRVLQNPNELMTTSEFIEKIMWLTMLNYNCFVIPIYEKEKLTGLYPVKPLRVDFLQDVSGIFYIKMVFENGYETTIPYKNVIHIRYKYSVNEFMGGNESGQPDNDALLKTLELNNTLLQGVAKAMKSSFSVNAVVKYNTMMDSDKTEKNVKELESKLKKGESGILPMDIKGEYVPIKRDIKLVDDDTLKFIDSKILRQFGVSLPILTGDYTKDQYEAFYQKTLEPLIISISQAFTKALFGNQKNYGNKIAFYSKELMFMSVSQKLEMVRVLGDSGSLYENEKRVAFGLRPLPELAGVRKQSLNYVDVEIANQYQLQNQNQKGGEENEGTGNTQI